MTTQTHKWLPSEPTDEMVNAALTEFNVPEGAFTEIFRRVLIKAWQAAPTREPLSSDEINALWVSFCSDLSIDTYADFVRLIEKAHGIGETKCI